MANHRLSRSHENSKPAAVFLSSSQAIADVIKQDPELTSLISTTRHTRLMAELQRTPSATGVLASITSYLETYGHQGYSLDFVEPTQVRR